MHQTFHQHRYLGQYLTVRFLLSVSMLFVLSLVMAGPTGVAWASSLAEDFVSANTFKPGLLVSSVQTGSKDLELTTIANSNYLLGIVEPTGAGELTFTKNGANTTVATIGVTTAYASDVNGEIKKGDFVGPSWVDGIGMKVAAGDTHKILGVAMEDFNTATAKTYDGIKTPGGTKTIAVNSLAIRLSGPSIAQPLSAESGVNAFANKLVGHPITFTRLVSGFLIFALCVGICAIFLASAIKNGFTAIGRNPLAGKLIYRSLWQVSVMSIIVILAGTAASYAVMAL